MILEEIFETELTKKLDEALQKLSDERLDEIMKEVSCYRDESISVDEYLEQLDGYRYTLNGEKDEQEKYET